MTNVGAARITSNKTLELTDVCRSHIIGGLRLCESATPGPANMAMLATGARLGFRAALPFMFGVFGQTIDHQPIGFGLMELAASAAFVFGP